MVDERLYINGNLSHQFLPQPLPRETNERNEELDIQTSATIEEGGSVFRGYSAKISSLDDIRSVLDSLMTKTEVANASHVIYAYRFKNKGLDNLPPIENFESDGDHGTGLNLLKKKCVIVK